jgi:hypothetical protein
VRPWGSPIHKFPFLVPYRHIIIAKQAEICPEQAESPFLAATGLRMRLSNVGRKQSNIPKAAGLVARQALAKAWLPLYTQVACDSKTNSQSCLVSVSYSQLETTTQVQL